jgi:tetratricopeptide (TPR) repeat protein
MEKLNSHFSRNELDGAGRLLAYWEQEARNLNDKRGLLEILNEEIGFFRRTANKEKGLAAVDEAIDLLEEDEVCDRISAGTVYLNAATTMKSFGFAADAIEVYAKAKEIYDEYLDKNDYRLAAYYNNISSTYKDLGEIKLAEESCYAAIRILEERDDSYGEIAITLISIAHLYHDADPFDERIEPILDRAWEYLKSEKNILDGDFAFICSKCYPSFGYFGHFQREAELKALTEKLYAGS